MGSNARHLTRLVRRQLLLTWAGVGTAWAYAYTLSGRASWNLSWTVLLWALFTVAFALGGVGVLRRAREVRTDAADRIAALEARVEELESGTTE